MTSMFEQSYENAREAQAKWAEAMQSVFAEARRAFDGETLGVDADAAGQRVQHGIDEVFDYWSKVVEFNRDVFKRVADANLEYLNVLQRQAEAAGGQALERFEEARRRSSRVVEETQEALARSASELEQAGNVVADKTAQQMEKNVDVAAAQTEQMSRRVADEAEKNAAVGEDVAESARDDVREAGAEVRKETGKDASAARSATTRGVRAATDN